MSGFTITGSMTFSGGFDIPFPPASPPSTVDYLVVAGGGGGTGSGNGGGVTGGGGRSKGCFARFVGVVGVVTFCNERAGAASVGVVGAVNFRNERAEAATGSTSCIGLVFCLVGFPKELLSLIIG